MLSVSPGLVLLLLALTASLIQEADLIDPLGPDGSRVAAVGKPAAEALMTALKTELVSAMREGGPVHAIDFCSERALALTDEVGKGLNGLGLKRTTLKPRNSANAPDEMELEVLQIFNRLPREAQPAIQVQKVQRGEDTIYRYYQPLYVASLCLTCHGERVPSAVQKVLAERYPNDEATGYREGDFRGLIRVEIPAAEIE